MIYPRISLRFLSAFLCLRWTAVALDPSPTILTSVNASSAVSTDLVHGFATVWTDSTSLPTTTNPSPPPYFTDSADTIPIGSREYEFGFPKYDDDQYHMVFNYKDTIQLLWTVFPPGNPPTLQIHCWNRTNPPNTYPLWAARTFDFKQDVAIIRNLNLTGNNSTSFSVQLEQYRSYNPCQFALVDTVNASLSRGLCVSSDFVILEDEAAPGMIWNGSVTTPQTITSTWTGSNTSAPDWWSEFGGDPPAKSEATMRRRNWGLCISAGLMGVILLPL